MRPYNSSKKLRDIEGSMFGRVLPSALQGEIAGAGVQSVGDDGAGRAPNADSPSVHGSLLTSLHPPRVSSQIIMFGVYPLTSLVSEMSHISF